MDFEPNMSRRRPMGSTFRQILCPDMHLLHHRFDLKYRNLGVDLIMDFEPGMSRVTTWIEIQTNLVSISPPFSPQNAGTIPHLNRHWSEWLCTESSYEYWRNNGNILTYIWAKFRLNGWSIIWVDLTRFTPMVGFPTVDWRDSLEWSGFRPLPKFLIKWCVAYPKNVTLNKNPTNGRD